ncbi:hypothetical protein WME89_11570 [Sorangium sp. So ce321]|uniref:hypothetical protein n=1 Tax=Sorangium sp. So ce321 TaxID=3133300 RepID=UPI003F5F170E
MNRSFGRALMALSILASGCGEAWPVDEEQHEGLGEAHDALALFAFNANTTSNATVNTANFNFNISPNRATCRAAGRSRFTPSNTAVPLDGPRAAGGRTGDSDDVVVTRRAADVLSLAARAAPCRRSRAAGAPGRSAC